MKLALKYFCLPVVLFAVFSIFNVSKVSAATLYFSPSSGNFSVGNILTTSILVDTQEKAINNADAVINFPAGFLEVVSVNKSGSIFSLWVEEPAFSNSAGTITFNGGLPTPGFNGTAGKIVNIVFRIRNAGTASLVFSSAAVRANDGYGTDILKSMGTAQFSFGTTSINNVPLPPSVTEEKPSSLQIYSTTHPDQNKWYAKKDVAFSWAIPKTATAVRLLYDKSSNSQPTILYDESISKKDITVAQDDIYYFHVQLKDGGEWGKASHFRFQVDTQKPESLDVNEVRRQDSTDPKARFIIDSTDSLSGIDHYEMSIDNQEKRTWQDDGTHVFDVNPLDPGSHTLSVKALDKAGNFLDRSIDFLVNPLPDVVITDYDKQLNINETLLVKGEGAHNAGIILFLQRKGAEATQHTTQGNQDGTFSFSIDNKFKEGSYEAWVLATDSRGAKSNPSNKVVIKISQPALLKIGSLAIGILSILIPLVALIILLVFILWYGWHKFSLLRKRLKKEIQEAESTLDKTFSLLRKDFQEQIKVIEKVKAKHQLTEEEGKIAKRLKKDLDDAENSMKKEIKDIKKEVK